MITITAPMGLRAEATHGPFDFCGQGLHPKYTRILGRFDVDTQVDLLWDCGPNGPLTGLQTPFRFCKGVWLSEPLVPLARRFSVRLSKIGAKRNANSVELYLEICTLKAAGGTPAPPGAAPTEGGPSTLPADSPGPRTRPARSRSAPKAGGDPPPALPDLTEVAERHRVERAARAASPPPPAPSQRSPPPFRSSYSAGSALSAGADPEVGAPPLTCEQSRASSQETEDRGGKSAKRPTTPFRLLARGARNKSAQPPDRLPGYIPVGGLLVGTVGNRLETLPRPDTAGLHLTSTGDGKFDWL